MDGSTTSFTKTEHFSIHPSPLPIKARGLLVRKKHVTSEIHQP
jgi:hypothetical protein